MKNEIAKIESLGQMIGCDPTSFSLWASFNTATDEGRKRAYNCTVAADFQASNVLGEEIEVEHAVVFPAQKVNEDTGELETWLSVVLVTPDGGTISVSSRGVIRALARLESMFGKLPWNPPLKLKIVQRPMAGGKRFYTIELP